MNLTLSVITVIFDWMDHIGAEEFDHRKHKTESFSKFKEKAKKPYLYNILIFAREAEIIFKIPLHSPG